MEFRAAKFLGKENASSKAALLDDEQTFLCPVDTPDCKSSDEALGEIRAYKLGGPSKIGKGKGSHNQIELVFPRLSQGGVEDPARAPLRVARAMETFHSGEVDKRLQESALKFVVHLLNETQVQVFIFLVYASPHGVTMGEHGPQYHWVPVTRDRCAKGCAGPILRGLQRFGKMPAKRGAHATDEPEGWKEPNLLYISIDEASTHVKPCCQTSSFRLLTAVFNDQGVFQGATVSRKIKVSSNNDAPGGPARFTISCPILDGPVAPGPATTRVASLASPRKSRTPLQALQNHTSKSPAPQGANSVGVVPSPTPIKLQQKDSKHSTDGLSPVLLPETSTEALEQMDGVQKVVCTAAGASKLRVLQQQQQQLLEDTNEKGYVRKQHSLGIVCHRFFEMFVPHPNSTIDLEDAAATLGVKKRRLYDIVGVLETVQVVQKRATNKYTWLGHDRLEEALQQLKADAPADLSQLPYSLPRDGSAGPQDGQDMSAFDDMDSPSSPDGDQEDSGPGSDQDSARDSQEPGLEHCLRSDPAAAGAEGSRMELSLRALTERFVQIFLLNEQAAIPWDVAIKVALIAAFQQPSGQAKTRRLYDIANILAALGLIQKTAVNGSPSFAVWRPTYRWLGAQGVQDMLRHISCGTGSALLRTHSLEHSLSKSTSSTHGKATTAPRRGHTRAPRPSPLPVAVPSIAFQDAFLARAGFKVEDMDEGPEPGRSVGRGGAGGESGSHQRHPGGVPRSTDATTGGASRHRLQHHHSGHHTPMAVDAEGELSRGSEAYRHQPLKKRAALREDAMQEQSAAELPASRLASAGVQLRSVGADVSRGTTDAACAEDAPRAKRHCGEGESSGGQRGAEDGHGVRVVASAAGGAGVGVGNLEGAAFGHRCAPDSRAMPSGSHSGLGQQGQLNVNSRHQQPGNAAAPPMHSYSQAPGPQMLQMAQLPFLLNLSSHGSRPGGPHLMRGELPLALMASLGSPSLGMGMGLHLMPMGTGTANLGPARGAAREGSGSEVPANCSRPNAQTVDGRMHSTHRPDRLGVSSGAPGGPSVPAAGAPPPGQLQEGAAMGGSGSNRPAAVLQPAPGRLSENRASGAGTREAQGGAIAEAAAGLEELCPGSNRFDPERLLGHVLSPQQLALFQQENPAFIEHFAAYSRVLYYMFGTPSPAAQARSPLLLSRTPPPIDAPANTPALTPPPERGSLGMGSDVSTSTAQPARPSAGMAHPGTPATTTAADASVSDDCNRPNALSANLDHNRAAAQQEPEPATAATALPGRGNQSGSDSDTQQRGPESAVSVPQLSTTRGPSMVGPSPPAPQPTPASHAESQVEAPAPPLPPPTAGLPSASTTTAAGPPTHPCPPIFSGWGSTMPSSHYQNIEPGHSARASSPALPSRSFTLPPQQTRDAVLPPKPAADLLPLAPPTSQPTEEPTEGSYFGRPPATPMGPPAPSSSSRPNPTAVPATPTGAGQLGSCQLAAHDWALAYPGGAITLENLVNVTALFGGGASGAPSHHGARSGEPHSARARHQQGQAGGDHHWLFPAPVTSSQMMQRVTSQGGLAGGAGEQGAAPLPPAYRGLGGAAGPLPDSSFCSQQ